MNGALSMDLSDASPLAMWTSVPQMPQAATAMRTSLALGSGTGTSVRYSQRPNSGTTMAFMTAGGVWPGMMGVGAVDMAGLLAAVRGAQ